MDRHLSSTTIKNNSLPVLGCGFYGRMLSKAWPQRAAPSPRWELWLHKILLQLVNAFTTCSSSCLHNLPQGEYGLKPTSLYLLFPKTKTKKQHFWKKKSLLSRFLKVLEKKREFPLLDQKQAADSRLEVSQAQHFSCRTLLAQTCWGRQLFCLLMFASRCGAAVVWTFMTWDKCRRLLPGRAVLSCSRKGPKFTVVFTHICWRHYGQTKDWSNLKHRHCVEDGHICSQRQCVRSERNVGSL